MSSIGTETSTFAYKNVIVRYGKANGSGDDASENLVYYTHRSQERKYMECHGGRGTQEITGVSLKAEGEGATVSKSLHCIS